MRSLDFINKAQKSAKIPNQLLPVLVRSVKIALTFKYNHVKFDAELLDMIELSDLLNGGS
jgi:hypothetical protein